MASAVDDQEAQHAALVSRRYLLRFAARDGALERIEVHAHEVDRLDAVLGDLTPGDQRD